MIYLKGIFVPTTTIVCVLGVILASSVDAGSLKFAYKKPILGKKSDLQVEQHIRSKSDLNRAEFLETITTRTTTTAPAIMRIMSLDSANFSDDLDINSRESLKCEPLNNKNDKDDALVTENVYTQDADTLQVVEEATKPAAISAEENVAAALETTSKSTTFVKIPERGSGSVTHTSLVPCSCGVFLSTQFKRGTGEPPNSEPVIVNELDRTYPCNSTGQKMCQRKCLETMVKHLPNSANILCATLDRDCRKERAFLFIKNCHNQWLETNLAAGREYCCRKGKSYPCPLI